MDGMTTGVRGHKRTAGFFVLFSSCERVNDDLRGYPAGNTNTNGASRLSPRHLFMSVRRGGGTSRCPGEGGGGTFRTVGKGCELIPSRWIMQTSNPVSATR